LKVSIRALKPFCWTRATLRAAVAPSAPGAPRWAAPCTAHRRPRLARDGACGDPGCAKLCYVQLARGSKTPYLPCARLRPPILAPQPGRSGPLISPAVPCDYAHDDAGCCDQGRQRLGQCEDVQHRAAFAVRGTGVNEWRTPRLTHASIPGARHYTVTPGSPDQLSIPRYA
jgi:hypothetical protein